ncbi:metal-dependent transcriptional regulator [Ruminococcus sp.]|uniref:metal-dependent transcriptional regulator n=1 Tax=Ruminococcus sp. TaxID=41978 RepID=UPI0025FAF7ED|nr:metal-dependent transcriptional regulator [Ruminococcus sp.]
MGNIHTSGEDYLEAILVLFNRHGEVRSVDIARELGVTKPSVSNAMKVLIKGSFIKMDENGFITLTEDGRYVAEKIYEKHLVLTEWLKSLGVDEKVSEQDACKIEHVISDESFSALKAHIKAQG